jgi:exopolysaccharide production protein ExoZ
VKPLISIQYLRAFAAIGVVAYHTGRATILGQASVDIFFVISGFVMWVTTTTKPIGPAQFMWRRVTRIAPLYWIATLIMAVLQSSSVSDTVLSLLFWPYGDAIGGLWPVVVQGWTLNFEMFFYLLFAATLIVPRRVQLLALTAVLCSLSAIGVAFQPQQVVLWTYTNPLFMEFLAGVWLSEIVQRGKIPGVKIALAMLFIGLLGFLISLRGRPPEVWRFILWGGPSLLVVYGAISIELRRSLPSIKSLKLLGDASYSIYLFHPFVVTIVASPLAKIPAVISVAAVVCAGAAIGLVVYYTLERPLLALTRPRTGGVTSLAEHRCRPAAK